MSVQNLEQPNVYKVVYIAMNGGFEPLVTNVTVAVFCNYGRKADLRAVANFEVNFLKSSHSPLN